MDDPLIALAVTIAGGIAILVLAWVGRRASQRFGHAWRRLRSPLPRNADRQMLPWLLPLTAMTNESGELETYLLLQAIPDMKAPASIHAPDCALHFGMIGDSVCVRRSGGLWNVSPDGVLTVLVDVRGPGETPTHMETTPTVSVAHLTDRVNEFVREFTVVRGFSPADVSWRIHVSGHGFVRAALRLEDIARARQYPAVKDSPRVDVKASGNPGRDAYDLSAAFVRTAFDAPATTIPYSLEHLPGSMPTPPP